MLELVKLIGEISIKPMVMLMITLLMTGCGTKHVIIEVPDLKPLVHQQQASVVVLYDRSLIEHSCTLDPGKAYVWVVELGQPTIDVLNEVWRSLFTAVRIEDVTTQRGQDLYQIEVYLDDSAHCDEIQNKAENVVLKLRFVFRGLANNSEFEFKVEGHAPRSGYRYSFKRDLYEAKPGFEQYIEYASSRMLRKVAANLLILMHTDIEFRQWEENQKGD